MSDESSEWTLEMLDRQAHYDMAAIEANLGDTAPQLERIREIVSRWRAREDKASAAAKA